MAGTSILPSADVFLAKRVQEMVLNGEEPPAPYICRDGDSVQEVSASLSPVPVIDIGLFSSSTPCAKQEEELQKLRSALSSWGCFQAIGHGISSAFLDKIRQVTREYFELPMDEKKKQAKGVDEVEGYGADPVPAEGQFLDWSDRLLLDVYPEDQRKPLFWPENPESFRGLIEEYSIRIKRATEITSKAMAKSLRLEENCFLKQFGDRSQYMARFNYYARCHRPDIVLGLKPHSDGTGYTIVLQDEEGIQVLKDEKWFTVPKIPEALLVLMGDQMEIMSNGMFRSPVHRVVTSAERERISIVVFYQPQVNKEIRPEEGLINEESPRLFKNMKDYATIHWDYYQKGHRAIHSAKV